MISHREQVALDSILLNVAAPSAAKTLEIIAEEVGKLTNFNAAVLKKKISFQEKTSPSGIGGGIALSHLQMDGIEKPVSILVRLKKPVEFNGVDEQPVDIVCFLLSPVSHGPHHLRRLSRFSRLLRDDIFCSTLRKLQDSDAIKNLFIDSQRQILIAA